MLFLIPWIYKTRKSIKLKYFVIAILIFILLLTPIFILNYHLHKSPFTFGVMMKSTIITKKSADKIFKNEMLNIMINTFLWIYNSLLSIPIRLDFVTLINSLKYYLLYDIFPGLMIFLILGYVVIFKEKEKHKLNFAIFSLIYSIFWIFEIIPRRELIPEDINRYFLMIYCFFILISVFFIFYLSKKFVSLKILNFIIIILLIIITVLNTSSLLTRSGYTVSIHNAKKQINKINIIIKDFPNNSIIVGDRRFFLHGITERKAFDLHEIKIVEKEENSKVATNYIKTLLNLNYPIYIIEENYINLTNHIQKNEKDLVVKKVISEDYFEIYKIFYREK